MPWLINLMHGSPNNDQHARLRVGARIVGALALIITMVWLGTNAYPYAGPEPLWTEQDLPTLPAEADNGWSLVTTKRELLEIPKPLVSIIDVEHEDADEFWNQVERDEDLLHEFLSTEDVREINGRVDQARQHAVFVDTCVSGEPCGAFDWLRAHQAAELRAIEAALAGDLLGASTLLRDLIRMDVAQLESAKSVLSVLVALKNLDAALAKADMIAAQGTSTALTQISDIVRDIDPNPVDLRQVVIAEYLSYIEILDALDGRDPQVRDRVRSAARPRWLFSHELTMRSVNALFERRYASAVEGDTFAALGGGESAFSAQWGWWFSNPAGKRLLDTMHFAPEDLAVSINDRLASIARSRARLLARTNP